MVTPERLEVRVFRHDHPGPWIQSECFHKLGFCSKQMLRPLPSLIQVVSLDAPLSSAAPGACLDRLLAEEAAPASASQLSRAGFMKEMIARLHDLDDRQLEVVTRKYGIHRGSRGSEPVSFRELRRRRGGRLRKDRPIDLAILRRFRADGSVKTPSRRSIRPGI